MSDRESIRVGVDVGGTFTKAVAISGSILEARAVAPTTHSSRNGVSAGIATVLSELLDQLGEHSARVELVAYSTTTAMNALLEGDVAKVGVVGIGTGRDARLARKRTAVGDIQLAQGKRLRTEHAFLDSASLSSESIDEVLDEFERAGCAAVVVSGAFAVDDAEAERLVAGRAREREVPVCAGHELSGTYGLETRTNSAAINASILPMVKRTARVVEQSLATAGLDVPLLVLKGDGGSMTLDAFRETPSFTIGSGPAAGVAATLHQLGLDEGLVLECGGTSSNVSIVKRGRAVLRTLRVMERPTAIRTVDSWVVGAAGGSMGRVARRRLVETGPRSAHVADLPYVCFAGPEELEGAEAELTAPRPGDPEAYAVLQKGERAWALTATCAAVALGLAPQETGSREAATAGFELLASRLRATSDRAARDLLDGATAKIARVVKEAARTHDFDPDVPLIALGGAGPILAPEVARMVDRPLVVPEHPEVLSSVGAALSLIRTEVARSAAGDSRRLEITRAAERACVQAGAAPQTVAVETFYEHEADLIRAVATGSVALQSGAAGRPMADEEACREAAATALSTSREQVELVTRTDFYRVYSGNGTGGCAIVDGIGSVPLAERATHVLYGDPATVLGGLAPAVASETVNLGIAEIAPRVVLVQGPAIVDLSDARSADEVLAAARETLDDREGEAVAVVWS
jgi:N-methylhydantoinase A/oxoprolinase/acetone carboxylase beta subunit